MENTDYHFKRRLTFEEKEELKKHVDTLTLFLDLGTAVLTKHSELDDQTEIDYLLQSYLLSYIERLDAATILIEHSSLEACNSILRTLFEMLLKLTYLVDINEEDTIDSNARAKTTICNDLVYKQKLINFFSPENETKRQKYFEKEKLLNSFNPGYPENIDLTEMIIEYGGQVPSIDCSPKYVDETFNVCNLSERYKFRAWYEIMYRGLSTYVHGNDILQGHITTIADYSFYKQIRYFDKNGALNITSHLLGISLEFFNRYCLENNYFNNNPDKDTVIRKVLNDWMISNEYRLWKYNINKHQKL